MSKICYHSYIPIFSKGMHFQSIKALQNKLFSQFPRIAITGYYIGKKEKQMKGNTKISHEKFHRSFRQKLLRADRAELTSSGFV
jgi:hypothetical protein